MDAKRLLGKAGESGAAAVYSGQVWAECVRTVILSLLVYVTRLLLHNEHILHTCCTISANFKQTNLAKARVSCTFEYAMIYTGTTEIN